MMKHFEKIQLHTRFKDIKLTECKCARRNKHILFIFFIIPTEKCTACSTTGHESYPSTGARS